MLNQKHGQNEMLFTDTFRKLKTVCDAVLLNPTHENITNMISVIENSNDFAFQQLWEYTVVPVHYHIHRHNTKEEIRSSSSLHDLLLCLKSVMSKTIINSTNKFILMNRMLTRLLFTNEFSLDKALTEEVRFVVVDCMYTLYKNLAQNVVYEIYKQEKNVNNHAETVYLCTQLILNENLLQIRIMAFQCILLIIRIYGCEQRTILTNDLKNDVSETVARMFPGIISVCSYIVQSSSLLHRDLYIFSVRLFGACVALIFENTAGSTSKGSLNFSNSVTKPEADFCVCCNLRVSSFRTNEWYRETAEKLIPRLENFVALCNSSQWKVRSEMMKMANLVLLKGSCIIVPVLMKLAEVLIILSRDEMEEIAKNSQLFLSEIFTTDSIRNEKLKASLKEQLFKLLDNLNSSINSVDSGLLISQLNLLNGYLEMLDVRLFWKCPVYLQKMFFTFKKLVRFDVSSISLDQNITDTNLHSPDNLQSITWKNMKYMSSNAENILKKVFQTIAKNSDLESLCIYLLDLLEHDEKNRKEIIYLINSIIFSSEGKEFDSRENLYRVILNIYIDSAYWLVPLPVCNFTENLNTSSGSAFRNNILQACLLTEGVGYMASSMGKHFKLLLIVCLYKIIERAGSANRFLSSIALQAIKKIIYACEYVDITHLLTENIDYITHNIYRKLRYLEYDTSVLDVFCVIVSHCQENSLIMICDLMRILLDFNISRSDSCCGAILRVLRTFSQKLRSLFTFIYDEDFCHTSESAEQCSNFMFTLNNYIRSTKEKRKNFTGSSTAGETDDNLDENDRVVNKEEEFKNIDQNLGTSLEETEKEEVKPPPYIELIVAVCEKVLHVLPSQNSWNKIIILEILIDGLLLLCDYEDQLLPLVHKIWLPLVNRLKNDNANYLIMRRCFELLCVMSVTARDFIRNRTLNDVLPVIHNFLAQSVEDSRLKEKKSVYRMSQEYKLQFILLRELGPLAVYISLQENHVQSLLSSVTPYLSSSQPLPLQNACVGTVKVIKQDHEDLVRIHLMSLWPHDILLNVPHSVNFKAIEIKVTECHPDYKKNIASLIEMP